MKSYLAQRISERIRLQLFVPKRRDPEIMRANAARRRVWDTYSELTYGRDAESAVWFNTHFLKYAGAVKLNQYGDNDK
jgi:hypothetical protein